MKSIARWTFVASNGKIKNSIKNPKNTITNTITITNTTTLCYGFNVLD